MATGRVLLAGAPGNRRLEWLSALLRDRGYETTALAPESGTSVAAPISLTPAVAGFDLWSTVGDARAEALAELDDRLPPSRPLLTLCHAASVDEAASYVVRPERVVGLSIFGPLGEGMLAELVPGLGTESGTVRRAAEFLETLGLQTEALPPGSWAVYPRVIAMIVNEAAVVIAESVGAASDIDTAMRLGVNYPRGPLDLADEIGLDEILAVLDALHAEYGDDRYRPSPLLRRCVLAGYTGKAAGRGFHLYP